MLYPPAKGVGGTVFLLVVTRWLCVLVTGDEARMELTRLDDNRTTPSHQPTIVLARVEICRDSASREPLARK